MLALCRREVIEVTDDCGPVGEHGRGDFMPDDTFSAMRPSITAGAPDTACDLAQRALAAGLAPLDAMQNGYVPGMQAVGGQFAQGKMFFAGHDGLRRSDAGGDGGASRIGKA